MMGLTPRPIHGDGAAGPAPRSGRRIPVAAFLIALVLQIIVTPLVGVMPHGHLAEAVLITAVLLFGVLTVAARPRTLVAALLLAIPALAGRWITQFWPELVAPWMFLGPGLLFCAFVTYHLLAFILRAERVDGEVLCAGVAGYLMLGVAWAFGYMLVASLFPHAYNFDGANARDFEPFDALYLSFITLNTVGYGDIAPVARPARLLAIVESTLGVMYAAVVMARLVALYSTGQPAPGARRPPGAPS